MLTPDLMGKKQYWGKLMAARKKEDQTLYELTH